MSSARTQQAKTNRLALASIIDTVKFCGRQNIALRGHRDSGILHSPTNFETERNEGNFRALLRFRISSGDDDLLQYVESAPLNAMYTSWMTQNEIIELCGEEIRRSLVDKVKEAKYFAVLADETSDIEKMEQLSICVRYVQVEKNEGVIREDFLGFEETKDLTGRSLAELLRALTNCGLNLNAVVGQGYDGAANMSGSFRGVQAIVKESYPKACYTHCSSHCLNLVISHACSDEPMKKTVRTLQDVIVFFTSSPKRTSVLNDAISALAPASRRTRLKSLCATRWVQRHEAVIVFAELYTSIVYSLAQIEDFTDGAAADKAEGFKHRIRTTEFICNLKILEKILGITFRLSVALQSKETDIVACSHMITDVKDVLQQMAQNAESEFSEIFAEIARMVDEQQIPLAARSMRSSSTEDVETHIREGKYKPFVNRVIAELEERFGPTFDQAAKCFAIIPFYMRTNSLTLTEDSEIFQLYSEELDLWTIFKSELVLWQRKWRNADMDDLPKNVVDSFNKAPADQFPNVRKLLQILATLPVTTASVERTFSQLRRLKTYLRNTTKEDRLNGLALLNIHREIDVPTQKIIDDFAQRKARRLGFVL